ncbi:MAG: DUF502 domain-containing protein [Planctomycetota bacterium]
MSFDAQLTPVVPGKRPVRPFRKALLRGVAVLAPPLLTVVILVWVAFTVDQYVLAPVTSVAREAMVSQMADIRKGLPLAPGQPRTALADGQVFRQLDNGSFIPQKVYDNVEKHLDGRPLPPTGKDFYRAYVDNEYLRPWIVIPVFLCVFTLLLYLVGKFLAAGIGRAFWGGLENTINRLPLIRSIYSAVKQFTDFFLTEHEIQFTRVVAIEYPRRGMWIVAFATSDSFLDIAAAANEPVVSVFVPTSPMPMTGFAVTLPRREVLDLNITIDQAIQFIVSCGVVAPPYELQERLRREKLGLEPAADGAAAPSVSST